MRNGLFFLKLSGVLVTAVSASCGRYASENLFLKGENQKFAINKSLNLEVAPDSELFVTMNSQTDSSNQPLISKALQNEIKQQFIMTLNRHGGIFQEFTNKNEQNADGSMKVQEIFWKELVVSKAETISTKVKFNSKLNRSIEEGSNSGESEPGFVADVVFDSVRTKYNLTFVLEDRVSQKVYRIPFLNTLDVQNILKVEGTSSLKVDAVAALQPKWLANIVSIFFKDINFALLGEGKWEKNSEIAPDLVFLKSDTSSFMVKASKEIVTPFCKELSAARNLTSESCVLNIQAGSSPIEWIEDSVQNFRILKIRKCEALRTKELMTPIYRVFAESDGLANVVAPGEAMNIFVKQGSVWKNKSRLGFQAEVLSVDKRNECGSLKDENYCVAAKIVALNWYRMCEGINSDKLEVGVSSYSDSLIFL